MKRSDSQGDLNGFLDAGSFIEGSLHFEDTFRLDGKLKGRIVSNGDLVVGERGDVEADLKVGRIFVSGTVRGSVVAQRRVEIAAGGKVFADIETPSLVVEDGATLQGQCNMSGTASGSASAGLAEKVTRLPVTKKG
ncbi:MAG: polymer-forming cytoskeletal protein [Thermoanaerobaculia bacterium]